MAESYQSFQGREPNIDVNLFVDAATKGIAQGNANPGVLGGIAKGINEGITGYVDTQQKVASTAETQAQTAAINAQNAVNTDPNVIAAKRQQEIAKGAEAERDANLARMQDEVNQNNADIEKQTMATELQNKLDQQTQIKSDFDTKAQIDAAIATNDPVLINQAFQNPKAARLITGDTKYGLPVLARAKGQLDPGVYNNLLKGASAVEQDKLQQQLYQTTLRGAASNIEKNQEKIDAAKNTLLTDPSIAQVLTKKARGEDFDPNKFTIIAASNTEKDTDKGVKFDTVSGLPVVAKDSARNKDDTRYFATYDGHVIGTYDKTQGEIFSKALPDYRLGIADITPSITTTDRTQVTADRIATQGTGLAALNQNLDKQLLDASPKTQTAAPSALPPASALQGQSPEAQAAITARYQQKLAQTSALPRGTREIVQRVNSDPLLKDQSPIWKAVISQESGGIQDSKSTTGVRGIAQVTRDTFAHVQSQNSKYLQPEDGKTEAGQLLAGKIYLTEQLANFHDMQLALAAYNAGPVPITQAIAAAKSKGPVTWDTVKEQLPKFIKDPDKLKEVQEYPEKVLRFYSIYNG